jgi:hypothetical protein
VAFKIHSVYNFKIKSRRKRAEVIQNYLNTNVLDIGQGQAMHRKYKNLKLGGGQACDSSGVLTAHLGWMNELKGIICCTSQYSL